MVVMTRGRRPRGVLAVEQRLDADDSSAIWASSQIDPGEVLEQCAQAARDCG